ncbi:hypothetical protein ADL21_26370 [Streptomyces albus subsp. albus]|nr:hypothetical protein ADL21_26370 [Streptomyces albus subsp. albus]
MVTGRAWHSKERCSAVDPDGRETPTRIGNAELGWNHFTGRHNIRKCDLLNIPIGGKADKKSGDNVQYEGIASSRRYGRYEARKGNTIGVITA